jgi:hypothetical protein
VVHMRVQVKVAAFLVGVITAIPAFAKSPTPGEQITAREAAALQEAFSHNLCARDDGGLRRLHSILSRKPRQ